MQPRWRRCRRSQRHCNPVGLATADSSRLAVLVASFVAVIIAGMAVWWVWPKGNSSAVPVQNSVATSVQRPPATESKSAPRLSIVVLPFTNLSNDPDQEYFADGITDDLTSNLSRISGSFVIARTTAFTYKGKPTDVKQIGRELGVRYVLEGSVRRTGDQVRMNAQLIEPTAGRISGPTSSTPIVRTFRKCRARSPAASRGL
jgi:adenylate cyclase